MTSDIEHLFMLLIFISLMTSDIEHLFMYYWLIHTTSFVKCLLKSFIHFYWVVCFLIRVVKVYLFSVQALFNYILLKFSLNSKDCFLFFDYCFEEQKLLTLVQLILVEPILSIFSFTVCVSTALFKNFCLTFCHVFFSLFLWKV